MHNDISRSFKSFKQLFYPIKRLEVRFKEFPVLIAMPDNPNPYSSSIIKHWDVYETSEDNIREIGKDATFHFGNTGSFAVFSIGAIQPSAYGPEWCFTLYATDETAFKSGLSKNIELSRENECNVMMCLHQPEFTHLYDSIACLKERNHDISLVLHERYLHKE